MATIAGVSKGSVHAIIFRMTNLLVDLRISETRMLVEEQCTSITVAATENMQVIAAPSNKTVAVQHL